ncbi:hypothetical protein BD289DRAFT_482724 [Coniella lustricola]|uniref:Uncharacterized protein n=1 Tax=Coniella lustricola TaxID=2025994 RepID=A0A2T3A7Y7_9PEZI|nr:hypothetical protein BD289DRAFT_482724 [Coniella lustricola]
MLPLLEVSHLPSASSFYAAITQPLGLQFVSVAQHRRILPSSEDQAQAQAQSITYGLATTPPTPFFDVAQVSPTAERPLKPSRLVLSAATPSVVRYFQAAVHKFEEASGRALDSPPSDPGALHLQDNDPSALDDWRLLLRATAMDQDGNTMEVIYVPPSQYPATYSGSTVRKTNSTEGEISRIMTWSYGVAASDTPRHGPSSLLTSESLPSSSSRHVNSVNEDDSAPVVRHTITTTTVYEPMKPPSPPPRQSSGSSLLATGAVVGLLGLTAAGAALGAGVAYGVMKERSRQDFDVPSSQRRSTCSESYPDPRSRYSDYSTGGRDPATLADRRLTPTLLTRYPHSRGPNHADGGVDDSRSRYSSRSRPPGNANNRTSSEASSSRRPLLLTEVDHRSHAYSKRSVGNRDPEDALAADYHSLANSRHTQSSPRHTVIAPSISRSRTQDGDGDRDRDSHVSNRTVSTLRGPPQPTVKTELTSTVSRPKPVSRVSSPTATRRSDSYVSAREIPPSVGRSASYVAATRAPLPASRLASSRADYEDDDICSIAPSESVSCVGSRQGSRA